MQNKISKYNSKNFGNLYPVQAIVLKSKYDFHTTHFFTFWHTVARNAFSSCLFRNCVFSPPVLKNSAGSSPNIYHYRLTMLDQNKMPLPPTYKGLKSIEHYFKNQQYL